jgi:peptidoglycan/LPS O-acetylase OafA/YrhL
MEKKPNKPSWSLIGYFILGLLFALLSILAKRPMKISYERMSLSIGIDTRWFFWLLLILSAICMAFDRRHFP